MNNRIIKLSSKCLNFAKGKVPYQYDFYIEIINLIVDGKFEDEMKLKLLIELYRYAFYNSVNISLDPRGDMNFKYHFLNNIKKGLESNCIDDKLIDDLHKSNEILQSYIDNPIDFIDQEEKFYKENPNTKF